MNTAAIVSTFTILGSLAYAAGQGAALRPQPVGAVTRSRVYEDCAVSQRHQGTTMAALAGGDGSCTIGEPLNWFTQVHPLPECAKRVWELGSLNDRTSAYDVDADGMRDVMVFMRNVDGGVGASSYEASDNVVGSGSNMSYWCCVGAHALFKVVTSVEGGAVSVTLHPVLSGELLRAAFCLVADCNNPAIDEIYNIKDLHDVDGDGDLDLIVEIYWHGSTGASHVVWIENTVKSDPALAADINRDGVVDGLDLTALLAAWTP